MKNLKKILLNIFYIIILIAFHFQLKAQQKVSNSVVIERYFQNQTGNVQNLNQDNIFNANNLISTLIQVGNNNFSLINSNSKSSQKVIQKGNNNNFELMSYYGGNNFMNLVSTQLGNNNSIKIIGNNRISEKLRITQRANNSRIIIRNYK